MNAIYLRRCRKVYVKEGTDDLPPTHLAALQKNIECLGFVLSQPLLDRLQTLSLERLGTFYRSLVKDLRELIGAHRAFKPMYPNFPEQVIEMSEAQLYLNALPHYFSNLLPGYEKLPRPTLAESPELRVIELGSKEDFDSIFTRLAGSKTSLSPCDKEDLTWFVAQYRDDILRLLPAEIPFKENLAFVGAQLLRNTTLADDVVGKKIGTATDVLRLAVALSDGDVSLAQPAKFGKLRRGERKRLLAWLELCGNLTEDMLRWKERWKRLGERLHPREYADRFPKAAAAFDVLRNDRVCPTFNGQIEKHLLDRDAAGVLELLRERPGDLARRLDHLLRLNDSPQAVMDAFCAAADRVSTPVLLQVLTHFQHRDSVAARRTFFPKGEVGQVYTVANRHPALPTGLAADVASLCDWTLVARFARLPRLGRCYLDPRLSNYLVPFSQRSAAKALRTLVRGSRLPLPDSATIRFFLWWKNGSHRADIDLSAALYDAEFRFVDVVSYYNLRNFGGHHSGDIVDAPQGAAEFIDLDVVRTIAGNVRYVVASLNSFTEQPFCDLPECFAGWMGRTHANSGEIFEPRTVLDRIDVASNTRICIPLILDLVGREAIWADIALRKAPRWNNVNNNLSGVSLMLRALTTLSKTDLHTLFALHIRARGEPAADPPSADTIFSVTEGITPFDLGRIAAEFL